MYYQPMSIEAAIIIGKMFCLTIIGIPFGKQYIKIAHLALTPFGARIERGMKYGK